MKYIYIYLSNEIGRQGNILTFPIFIFTGSLTWSADGSLQCPGKENTLLFKEEEKKPSCGRITEK